jgi:uncharacterized SAM-binding protein YcdF (DUF218 family)
VPSIALAVFSPWLLPWLGHFLIENDLPPAKADAALVLAGDMFGRRIMKGADMVKRGLVPVAYVSGPDELYGFTEDYLAIQYAVQRGADAKWFIGMPNQANSTEEEASQILPELNKRGVRRLMIISSNYHTRRAKRIFTKVAARSGYAMRFQTVAADDALFNPDHWWKSRPAQKIVLLEWTKTLTEPFGL